MLNCALVLVENNGFEPFAPACKAGVLAKYTNPPLIPGKDH